jgi:hypothetical protein
MKLPFVIILSGLLLTQVDAQTSYTGHGTGSSSSTSSTSSTSSKQTRVRREPQVVQTKVYAKSPVYHWIGSEGYVDEKTGKTVGDKRRQVLTGYNVTYRVVYDNGSEAYYTNFEAN